LWQYVQFVQFVQDAVCSGAFWVDILDACLISVYVIIAC
jgi:hypothetical protein